MKMIDFEKTSFEQSLIQITKRANITYENTLINNSLFEGTGGQFFLNLYAGLLFNDVSYFKNAKAILKRIMINIHNGEVYDYYSFALGLSGLCWLLENFSDKLECNINIDPLIDNIILESALNAIETNNSDFLYGAGGALYYFATKKKPNHQIINVILEKMTTTYVTDDLGFRLHNSMLKEYKAEEYDIGFAHGLAGYTTILAEIYNTGDKSVSKLIYDAVKYFKRQYNPYNSTGSFYPASVIDNEPINEGNKNIRLGWCYGDISIAHMLLNLSVILNDKELYLTSINLALRTTIRSTPTLANVTDINLCHGASHLVIAYYNFYIKTLNKQFINAHLNWRNYMITEFQSVNIDTLNFRKINSLLTGTIGYYMSLIRTNYHSIDSNWLKCLLINTNRYGM